MNKENQSSLAIKDIIIANQAEKDVFGRIKKYKAIMDQDINEPINPREFAKFNNIEITEVDTLDKNDLIGGFLAIDKNFKVNIFLEDKKQTDKEKNYTIAYLSSFHIATQDLIDSPGLVHDYNKYRDNNGMVENICHQAAKEILMPEKLFRKKFKEYKESNRDIEILTNIFNVDIRRIAQRIQDLGL